MFDFRIFEKKALPCVVKFLRDIVAYIRRFFWNLQIISQAHEKSKGTHKGHRTHCTIQKSMIIKVPKKPLLTNDTGVGLF